MHFEIIINALIKNRELKQHQNDRDVGTAPKNW
jgi:hypothetical protein